MALSDELDELARKHGATSYRNRADTQNPAYGFTPAGLLNLLAEVTGEVRKQDESLIRQLAEELLDCSADSGEVLNQYQQIYTDRYKPHRLHDQERVIADADTALAAARKRLEGGT